VLSLAKLASSEELEMQNSRAVVEPVLHRLAPAHENGAQVPDFVDFLSERLSTNRADAMDVLAKLLAAYRPARTYEICVLDAAHAKKAG
jgi:hypothetical protein